jgi:predicted transcriptional regulator
MHRKRGGNLKITPEVVLYIRKLAKNGWRQHEIATKIGISQQAVSLIISRKRWAEIK